jgi:hypothetical protein
MIEIIALILAVSMVLVAIVIPRKYRGVVVFDVDNTILCNGSMMGNSKCTFKKLSPTNPCTDKETIYSNKAPQIIYGGTQPTFDGTCLKEELKDGRDISCSIHSFNPMAENISCDPSIDPKTGFPVGIDCDAQTRAKKIIKMCRDKKFAVAINTAEGKEDVIKFRMDYLKTLGFTDDELKFIEDGGIITYNKTKATDMYTQAKQKGINMIALAEKFGIERQSLILIDDQMANCKAVRDMGFQAYNCSTTFGETYGWSCFGKDSSSTCHCGITDNQINEIFKLIE